MDGRRHSVDVPISKALVALRRVRSLRDPSTHSMSKHSALVDDVNWDTNSFNGISLRFGSGCDRAITNGNDLFVFEPLGTCSEDEEMEKGTESHDTSIKAKPKITSCVNACLSENKLANPSRMRNDHEDGGSKLHLERYCSNQDEIGLDLACVESSNNRLEGGDSSREPNIRSMASGGNDDVNAKYKRHLRNHMRSPGLAIDLASRAGSPCAYPSDSTSLFANDDVDVDSRSYQGCGISCCWSGTPRFRALSLLSDEDNYPLLSGEIGDTDVSGQSRSWKHVTNELVPYADTPRSLSQKFKPKSFSELVGQSVVARSLLGAISKGRITPLYLFHGPRGTGKTCAARIFAAALNCLSTEQHRPCGLCQECLLYFAGRSRDAKEIDSVRINRTNRVRSLIKNGTIPPVSSRFKVFIIDECQLLRAETWATLLSGLDGLSRHAIFILVTADIDKVPRSAVARAQRYHFPKINKMDISSRLGKICVEEGLEFEQVALDFIAAKSCGSLRDAEMMLEQLSLLSKEITMTLAYELIGSVSDAELLDLLDLALSADTSNTVKRARELMSSRIDPMQLISQLANIIMDILAGKPQEESSEVKRSFLQKHASDMDLEKLRNALRILSESEKQLRASKNQTTWLTVALLQLNTVDSSQSDPYEPRLSLKATNSRDGDCCSTSSPGERSKHIISLDCDGDHFHQSGSNENLQGLETIWMRATEICESSTLRNFLRKRGRLASVCVKKGLAVAELEFSHPHYVSKAEKSWKQIAGILHSVLRRNVELRLSFVPTASHSKTKRLSFSLFSCSRRMYGKSQPFTKTRGDQSDFSNCTSGKAIGTPQAYPGCGSCLNHVCNHQGQVIAAIRNSDGNTLSTGTSTPHRLSQDSTASELCLGATNSCREHHGGIQRCKASAPQGAEVSPDTMKLDDRLIGSDKSKIACLNTQPHDDNVSSSMPGEASFDAYICTEYPYILCNGFNSDGSNNNRDEGSVVNSKVHCWRTPQFPANKGVKAKNQGQKSHLVEWVLPCATAK